MWNFFIKIIFFRLFTYYVICGLLRLYWEADDFNLPRAPILILVRNSIEIKITKCVYFVVFFKYSYCNYNELTNLIFLICVLGKWREPILQTRLINYLQVNRLLLQSVIQLKITSKYNLLSILITFF